MLIFGAKGFAKEVLEVCHQNNEIENLVFYDDVNKEIGDKLYDKYTILKTLDEAKKYFKMNDNSFTLGLGNPLLRYKSFKKLSSIGGELVSTISPDSKIGNYGVNVGAGCNVLSGTLISNDVQIGMACILYFNSILSHDCFVGDFVEVSPGATVLGHAKIGRLTQLGAQSTVLPGISVGENVTVGAGSIVTKNIPDNSVVVGVPAKVIKENKPVNIE